jgi:hypothetical protein
MSELSAMPFLFGFAPGGVYPAISVAGDAVRSYRTFSPLPAPQRRRFFLCGTFPGVAPAGCYPAPFVCGARTFLSRDLSIIAGTAARPTDLYVMPCRARGVKCGGRWPCSRSMRPELQASRGPPRHQLVQV